VLSALNTETKAALPLASSLPPSANEGDALFPVSANERLLPIQTTMGQWERWFAWDPVRLYMTSRIAWLSTIHRRCVTKGYIASCDYTDTPDEFPTNNG
jgi:hypothetical protein